MERNYRMKILWSALLHRATIKKKIEDRKKLQGKNIMAPLLHRAAIKREPKERNLTVAN